MTAKPTAKTLEDRVAELEAENARLREQSVPGASEPAIDEQSAMRADAYYRGLHDLMGQRPHSEGCPAEAFTGVWDDVEGYDTTRVTDDRGRSVEPHTVGVIRCLRCRGHRVLDEPLYAALERLGVRV